MNISKEEIMTKVIIVLIIIFGIFLIKIDVYNDHTCTATVTDKERIVDKDNTSKYLIFTETEGGKVVVFENTDSFFRGKFDSSDIQGSIKIGKTYDFTVIGYRIPLFSTYENIVDCYEITN